MKNSDRTGQLTHFFHVFSASNIFEVSLSNSDVKMILLNVEDNELKTVSLIWI